MGCLPPLMMSDRNKKEILAMSGIIELEQLLSSMGPKLMDEEFVFCTVPGDVSDYLELNPLATFRENEGLTLVLTKKAASNAGLSFESTFKQITLTVHSSLDAVGLTAAVASKLASKGISCKYNSCLLSRSYFRTNRKGSSCLVCTQRVFCLLGIVFFQPI
jgi:hypothetical protein